LELYIVYISESDFLKEGKTIYHVDKILRETGTVIDDGLHEIFVNAQIDDGTDIAELMSCFKQEEVNNPKFPETSAEVARLKETEGGTTAVCEVMEKYEKIAVSNALQNERIEKIIRMLELKCPKEFISSIGYTEDEISEAQKQITQ